MAADYILGIDYGDERVGLAIMQCIARLPHPFKTIPNNHNLVSTLVETVRAEQVGLVVVGVPRNMDGSESDQSERCRMFAASLRDNLTVVVEEVDETLSSVEAEQRLQQTKKPYKKADIDAEAAAIMLERYAGEYGGKV